LVPLWFPSFVSLCFLHLVSLAALYETLATLAPSPVVELNRAVALAMAFGPQGASISSMH